MAKKNFKKSHIPHNLFSGIGFSTSNSLDTLNALNIANPEELIGTVILDKYEVKEFIAAGGFSFVYKVWHLSLNQYQIIKIIYRNLANANQELIKHEAKQLSKLKFHPNIVQLYDLDVWKGMYILREEFIEGVSLEELIIEKAKSGKPTFSEKEALGILRQILEGLRFSHSRGVVHRDLKPKNILITKDGTVKILDFGISYKITHSSLTNLNSTFEQLGSLTSQQPEAQWGTPLYMSPEQVRGEKNQGREVDIWSFGVIAYQLLTGSTPFSGPSSELYKAQLENLKPDPPKKHNPSISQALNDIVMKCLEKNKKRRYRTVDEILRDLDKAETKKIKWKNLKNNLSKKSTLAKVKLKKLSILVYRILLITLYPFKGILKTMKWLWKPIKLKIYALLSDIEDFFYEAKRRWTYRQTIVIIAMVLSLIALKFASYKYPKFFNQSYRVSDENLPGRPFFETLKKGKYEISKFLFFHGYPIASVSILKNSPIAWIAVSEGRLNVVKYLIKDLGFNVNTKNKKGETLLHWAAYYGQTKIVKYLTEKGADVNAKDRLNRTPLFYATIGGYLDICKILVNHGAILKSSNCNNSPIIQALLAGHLGIVKYFIEDVGFNINKKDEKGWTLLHYAIFFKYKKIAKYLINKGANVNIKSKNGYTPLVLAKSRGLLDIVKLLKQHGARE